MDDPTSFIASGITIAQGTLSAINYAISLNDGTVLAALFSGDGTKIEGDEEIVVERNMPKDDIWWFHVKDLDGYVFQRFPVIDSVVHEVPGQSVGDQNPGTKYWRWIAQPNPGVIIGGNNESPNIVVDFIVIGYQPKALIKSFKKK